MHIRHLIICTESELVGRSKTIKGKKEDIVKRMGEGVSDERSLCSVKCLSVSDSNHYVTIVVLLFAFYTPIVQIYTYVPFERFSGKSFIDFNIKQATN